MFIFNIQTIRNNAVRVSVKVFESFFKSQSAYCGLQRSKFMQVLIDLLFFRLMSDMLRSAPQSDTGFMIYSAMLSMGSCIGYLLSAVDWQTFSQTTLCSSEQTAILIVLFLFSITLLVTMLTAQEHPLKTKVIRDPQVNHECKAISI